MGLIVGWHRTLKSNFNTSTKKKGFSLQNMFIWVLRALSVDSLNGGSTDALTKAPVGKKIGKKKVKCHIFASISPTERYNHLKRGTKCHLIPLETSFLYLPDRPTAEKPRVKNPPFKESTDNALRV